MRTKEPVLLIMAAGMGNRYGGLKQLDKIGFSGETIMEYSIYDAIKAGFKKVVFVVRESFFDDIKNMFEKKISKKVKIEFVTQEINKIPPHITIHPKRQKPWGTGHAILMASEIVDVPFAVINADDFYGYDTFVKMYNFLANTYDHKTYALAGFKLSHTMSKYGSVSRGVCRVDDNGFLSEIHERIKIQYENDKIYWIDERLQKHLLSSDSLVSMNFWGFPHTIFNHLDVQFLDFLEKNGMNLSAEFYIPEEIGKLLQQKKINVKVLSTDEKWYGITYKEDRETVVHGIRSLVEKGNYPKNLWK